MRIEQWLPAAHRGDAIGDEAVRIDGVLRRAGFETAIRALEIDDDASDVVMPFDERDGLAPEDVVVLHFALPSPLTERFRATRARKVLVYHNVTPASFFVGLDDELVRIAARGREELASLAGATDLALGDSEFNRAELVELGFARTGVLPILLDFDRYRTEPNPVVERMLDDGRTNFLFVGRVFPNKRFEDLVRFAFFYKKYVSENFRFLLVGRPTRMERYRSAVEALAERWGLRPSEVRFTGRLAWDELVACYRTADVFVSMSEHEGFAVPLVEAMVFDVPVMAYASTAVPDTLGGAGVLFHEKKYEELAEMAALLATDGSLRRTVLEGQRARLERFRPERVEAELLGYLEEVCG